MRESPTLVSAINELERNLIEIKNSPQFFADDSLIAYKTYSADAYDLTTTLSIGETKKYRLTFDYAIATGGAILELNAFYRLDDPDVMSDPALRNPPFNPHVQVHWEKENSADTQTTWIITVRNISFSLTPVPYIKFFIDGTDTGSWSIVAI